MFFNVNLALALVPKDAELQGFAAGAFQAEHMAKQIWSGLWWLALINGFWILFSTHLGNTDVLVRTTADILWAASPRCRKWPISRIYAGLLIVLTAWAVYAIRLGSVLDLFKVLGMVATPILALAAVQILRINTRFLPQEIQPPWWRKLGLLGCAAAYGGMAIALVTDYLAR